MNIHKSLIFLLVALLSVSSILNAELPILGASQRKTIRSFGSPDQILGPKNGIQTYEYSTRGIAIVFKNHHVYQYIIKKNNSYFTTTKGISIGSSLSTVTDKYGQTKETINVEKWFTGYLPKVLYHHPKYNKYKINYPNHNLFFQFNKNKNVERIVFGFIYAKK